MAAHLNKLNPSEISSIIQEQLEQLDLPVEKRNEGTIVRVNDGILQIHGLGGGHDPKDEDEVDGVMAGEMLICPSPASDDTPLYALALNLEEDSVGAVVLGPFQHLREGQTVQCTGEILKAPVGEALLGRVLNATGQPIDEKGPLKKQTFRPIEQEAPGVIARQSVGEPLQTGLKSIDAMVPIGRGQRELIIGDRQTGKTAIAIDTIINQKDSGIKCIYVAIGQKASSVANLVRKLEEHDALSHTIIVAANASDPAALQYLAPFTACAMGEYFRDKGEDALIVYDDLTKHAWAYRQIALLLRRPPGREAYPGDVFYLHSRLLERASRVNADYVKAQTGGNVTGRTGSLTALPIIETQAGDVSAFVPTNVISITDGQIYLDTNLFNAGLRPAVNAGLSVSRVGGAAQTKIMKKLAGSLRLSLAQYRELEAFSQFASDLDDTTKKQLAHGKRLTEMMKQKQYAPLSVAKMAISLFLAENGYLTAIEPEKINDFEEKLYAFFDAHQSTLLKTLQKNPVLSDEHVSGIKKAIEAFQSQDMS